MKKVFIVLVFLTYTIAGYSAVPSKKPRARVENPSARPAVPDSSLLHRPFGRADEKAFLHPDRIFFPETWFHFINGNIRREGIRRDLEAIAASGIQGIQLFHGQMGNPADWPGTEEHIECLSPKWEDLVKFTASEAHRLGLRFSLQTCPGWAMSGGPWIKPEQAMRHLKYVRLDAVGGASLDTPITLPEMEDWRDWRDIAVLAFPCPEGDTDQYCTVEDVVADENQEEWEQLLVHGKGFKLPPSQPSKPYRFSFRLKDGARARSVVFNPIDNFNHSFVENPAVHLRITTTSQGQEQVVLDTDFPRGNWQDNEFTMTFAIPEKSDDGRYTVEITNQHDMSLRQIRFSTAARCHNWEMEAGWTLRSLLPMYNADEETPARDGACFVRRSEVLDISDRMDAEGRLRWTAPQSHEKWVVLRIGHVNTGRRNAPAPAKATGWEVNKLDTAYVRYQFRSYIGRLADGPLKGLLDNMLMDSWECASQTWTRYMREEFRARRHYDLTSWMPALLGWVMDSREENSRFLADWRRTINELFTDNFYGQMVQLAREKGMTSSYETAAGDAFPADPLEFYKYADVPMTEYWQPFSHSASNHDKKPIRATTSAARMYGKPRVSAESFTSFVFTWDEHLSMLREVANQSMVEGVTHTVFHTYTHNPDADRFFPGSSFGAAIGTPFLRKQTWWPYMRHFNTYLARCAFMLERGKPVSSVLWYLGDETEQKPDQNISFPEGYAYDYCNTDALLHRIRVRDGRWLTPEGIAYDLLWIPRRGRLLPETLERLAQLVAEGGRLAGEPPTSIATLSAAHQESWRFRHSSAQLWSDRHWQEKLVVSGCSLAEALERLDVQPDVRCSGLRWLHRQDEGADWYMVCPQKERDFAGSIAFRQTGRAELWNPMNGTIEPIPTRQDGPYASIDLHLCRGEMLFVVFRHDGLMPPATSPCEVATHAVDTPWTLTFPQGWGIDSPLTLTTLLPWKDLPLSDEGKAFSGTATYETTFSLARTSRRHRYVLSLGSVDEIAVVSLNGHVIDTLWAEPYQTDVTRYIKRGRNHLVVQVTSTWFNRLVYDASLPEKQRRTWATVRPQAGQELRPSGLMGKVEIKVYSL